MTFQKAPLKVFTLVYLYMDGKVLLMKRRADRHFLPGWYHPPGGKLDATDTTLEGAAAREFEEEVGVTPTGLAVRGAYTYFTNNPNNPHGSVFLMMADGYEGELNAIGPEGDELVWLTEAEILASEHFQEDHKRYVPTLLAGQHVTCCLSHWADGKLLDWQDSDGFYAPSV